MFTLKDTAIDPDKLKAQTENPKSGGFVCFEGWVRNHNHGESVEQLHYSSHQKQAISLVFIIFKREKSLMRQFGKTTKEFRNDNNVKF